MTALFQCPECHADHTKPLSPAFVLAVKCTACDLSEGLDAAVALSPAALPLAA
jgi:hypothetical protein